MRQSERALADGVHPRVLVDGFERAKVHAVEFLERYKTARALDRALMLSVAQTSLRTKVSPQSLADQLAGIVVDAVEIVRQDVVGGTIDLHMVEVMQMKHRLASETRLVRGLVLDHGARHHDMPHRVENAYILTCNVSMEYEKSEVTSTMTYTSAEQRVQLAAAERALADATVKKAIELKRAVIAKDPTAHFVVINQKGVDPPSLQAFADEGIIAIRRAKRRNMERLTLACGGTALNTLDGATIECLGHADVVYEQVLGEDKFTFVEGCRYPRSCTILVKGPDDHTISQLKDAIRDGLRAVKNVIEDGGCVVAGAGAFEVACAADLLRMAANTPGLGKAKLGIEAFARALLIVPKTLAENAGFDAIDTLLALQDEHARLATPTATIGVDLASGKPCDAAAAGIWDNVCVKRRVLQSAAVVAAQLLLVDVIMRAGKSSGGRPTAAPGPLE